jgi:L-amino acid N-acyltransferase YncA
MPVMLIREAHDGDWSLIWPFWRKVVAPGETYTWDQDTPEEIARDVWMSAPTQTFVVEDDGRVIASAYLKPNYGGAAAHVANAGFMVDPDHTGRGIGRQLAKHVLAEATRLGYRAMVFNSVVETNPAVNLWRSLGFTIVGTIPKAFQHPVHGLVGLHIMHREL